jgi:predicted nucleic acid-binding protein
MSLREDILKRYIITDNYGDIILPDEVINKVLDAAIDECYQWFKQAEDEELSFDDLISRIEAIKKPPEGG